MKCLVFNSETEARQAEKAVWIRYVSRAAVENPESLRLDGVPPDSFETMSDDMKYACDIAYGIKGLIVEKGRTVGYDKINKIFNTEKWWINKPENKSFTEGLSGFEIMDYDSSWSEKIED